MSIDDRPPVVDEKTRIGDWEIDLVIGAKHCGALQTIVELKTRFTVSKRVNDKSAKTVTATTIELLTPYKEAVFTVTQTMESNFLIMKTFLTR